MEGAMSMGCRVYGPAAGTAWVALGAEGPERGGGGGGAAGGNGAEARLRALGIELPSPTPPVAAYVPTRRAGALLVVSGQLPFQDGVLLATGRVGGEVDVGMAQACARRCVVNGLAAVRAAVGTLEAVRGVVRVGVFVACVPEFTDHPRVANGASELLVAVFGESGRHARAAVGAPSLPLNAPVEVEMMVELSAGS
jgi:enamine deaminase RidA (YjgF/YER057c/UK114 family)